MKSICLSMLLVLSITSTAQIKTLQTSAPGLIINKTKLGSIVSVETSRRDPPPNIDDSHAFETNPPGSEWQGKAELEVQNTGSKSIKSIDWTLLVIVEGNSKMKIQGYFVRSKKEIRPGETVKVTSWFKGANLNEWRKRLGDGSLQTQAQITQINFADGSRWVR